MWWEFYKFDLGYQLRQPLLWASALLMALLAFGASSSDAVAVGGAIGNVNLNAPVVIAQLFGVFSILSLMFVTIFIAGTVLRDSEIGISDMLFATPMRKHDYLIGRFAAGLVACLFIFLLVAIGMMLGPLMPWVDAERVGPFSAYSYLWSFAVFVIPNLLFVGAMLMLLAATTRSIMFVYVGVLGFFMLWAAASALTRDINNEWIAVLVDPFGVRAFARMTRYFSPFEANSGMPTLNGYLLANRLLWSSISLILFGLTVALFKPQAGGTARRLFGKAKKQPRPAGAAVGMTLPEIEPRFGCTTVWKQCWHILCFDAKAVFKGVPFIVMLLFGVMNLIAGASQSGTLFGTTVYPVTHLMVELISGSFNLMLIIILTFYAGELIFKERQARIADITDALPVPNWVPLVAKSMALVAVIVGFMVFGALAAIGFQLVRGGATIETVLYLKAVSLGSLPFVLMGLFALALQILVNNKFVAYVLMSVLVMSKLVLGLLHFDHNLYNFASLPNIQYSDMNGYGHFLRGWSWYALYWSAFTMALMIAAQAFWVRGISQERRARIRMAGRRLNGAAGVALAAALTVFAGSGAWIFYNTNVLNKYYASDAAMDEIARYEKLYRQYKDRPQPKITGVRADVDIYPDERRAVVKGHYVLHNKSAMPLDTLFIQENSQVETIWSKLPAHQLVLHDKPVGLRIIKLSRAMAPGESLELDFVVNVRHPGFTNSGAADSLNLNGTFFNNAEFFPHFGYNRQVELTDRNERRKRGLGEPDRMAKLEDKAGYVNSVFGNDSDWINFETTVSTSSDQIAIAPGTLLKSWEANGRRYFHYKMDQPMVPFFAYLSARWNVRKGQWHGLPIEVYYDPKHAFNVDRMIFSTQKSLDYFTAQFAPYQHKQVRIIEFPAYQSFAQSFANTIPYSEAIGFIADLRDKDDIDYVFYVTAHEMAHQWWGQQVSGANVQGATMLIESLAQYSALMVMEKEYGPAKLRRFLRYELDRYLRDRRTELVEELPLLRVENQQYIHYRKGSLIFYRLRDEIGEAPLNRALKRYLHDKAFQQAPFTTAKELLEYIRAEAPLEKQALITDMFEKIVFYDNRVREAKATKRADGLWDVSMKLHLAKMEADGKGKETVRSYDEPVEIAIFARAPGGKESDERVLFIETRRLQGSDPTVTVKVKEKPFEIGVDPYNKLIDRVPGDNRKQVSFN